MREGGRVGGLKQAPSVGGAGLGRGGWDEGLKRIA